MALKIDIEYSGHDLMAPAKAKFLEPRRVRRELVAVFCGLVLGTALVSSVLDPLYEFAGLTFAIPGLRILGVIVIAADVLLVLVRGWQFTQYWFVRPRLLSEKESLGVTQTLTFGEDEVVLESPTSKLVWAWEHIEKRTDRDDHILLWHGRRALVIPKRQLDADQASRLAKRLAQRQLR